MSLLQHASFLNNSAVQCMILGNYEKSIETFGLSIKALKAELRSRPTENPTNQFPSHYLLSKMVSLSKIEIPQPSGRRRQDSLSFIFSQTFQIPERFDEDASSTEVFVYCSQVIFNLALAHHCMYLRIRDCDVRQQQPHHHHHHHHQQQQRKQQQQQRNQQQQEMLLRKTVQLYAAARAVLERDTCENNCTGWIVHLACSTNASQLIRSSSSSAMTFGDLQSHDRTCEAVRYLSVHCDEIFQDPRLEGLLNHVLLLESPTLAPAA